MIEVGDLEGGESASPTAEYDVDLGDVNGEKRGRSYIYNTACVVSYDEEGTQLARANAGCSIIVI